MAIVSCRRSRQPHVNGAPPQLENKAAEKRLGGNALKDRRPGGAPRVEVRMIAKDRGCKDRMGQVKRRDGQDRAETQAVAADRDRCVTDLVRAVALRRDRIATPVGFVAMMMMLTRRARS